MLIFVWPASIFQGTISASNKQSEFVRRDSLALLKPSVRPAVLPAVPVPPNHTVERDDLGDIPQAGHKWQGEVRAAEGLVGDQVGVQRPAAGQGHLVAIIMGTGPSGAAGTTGAPLWKVTWSRAFR